MRKIWWFALAAVVGALVIAGLSGTGEKFANGPLAPDDAPGSAAVYDRIGSLTDCSELQAEFDLAVSNHEIESDLHNLDLMKVSTSYMDAADDRMDEIGCYD